MIICAALRFTAAKDHINHGNKIAWGEGIMFGYIYNLILATLFIIIMLFNTLLRESGKSFYYWMCLFIMIPLIIVVEIS